MRLTDEDKERIAELRAAGNSYQRISDELGFPLSTVKSYIRRHGVGASSLVGDETTMYVYCLHCGAKLQHLPKKKRKKFCSDKCRTLWWSEHKDKICRKKVKRCCVYCGKEFEADGSSPKKYCSSACYFKDRFQDYTPKAQRNDCGAAAGGEKCATLLDGCLCASCAWFYDGKRHCTGCETVDKSL